jgi:hypothetical protein
MLMENFFVLANAGGKYWTKAKLRIHNWLFITNGNFQLANNNKKAFLGDERLS